MRKKILLVDDSVLVLKLASTCLQCAYEVVTACSGQEAFKKALTESPDLILMDFHMPGMDGRAVAESLERVQSNGRVPVVMMTTESELPKLGGLDYLVKPFDAPSLLSKVG